jgi:hypothetical protein
LPGGKNRRAEGNIFPVRRMFWPALTLAVKRTPSSVCSVSSCITTASQPAGTGAPVMMRTQVPAGHSP